MSQMTDSELNTKAQNHLKKVDGGGWRLIDRYTDGTALIRWFKGNRSYNKTLK